MTLIVLVVVVAVGLWLLRDMPWPANVAARRVWRSWRRALKSKK